MKFPQKTAAGDWTTALAGLFQWPNRGANGVFMDRTNGTMECQLRFHGAFWRQASYALHGNSFHVDFYQQLQTHQESGRQCRIAWFDTSAALAAAGSGDGAGDGAEDGADLSRNFLWAGKKRMKMYENVICVQSRCRFGLFLDGLFAWYLDVFSGFRVCRRCQRFMEPFGPRS